MQSGFYKQAYNFTVKRKSYDTIGDVYADPGRKKGKMAGNN